MANTRSILMRMERAQIQLIQWSAPKLTNDVMFQPVRPPVSKPATATIGEIIAAKKGAC